MFRVELAKVGTRVKATAVQMLPGKAKATCTDETIFHLLFSTSIYSDFFCYYSFRLTLAQSNDRFLFGILLKEELSSCNGNRPVCGVDQMIDALTVLRGQHLLCTTVEKTTITDGQRQQRIHCI